MVALIIKMTQIHWSWEAKHYVMVSTLVLFLPVSTLLQHFYMPCSVLSDRRLFVFTVVLDERGTAVLFVRKWEKKLFWYNIIKLCYFTGKAFIPKKMVDPIIESVTLEPELEEALASASDAELCDIAGITHTRTQTHTYFTQTPVSILLFFCYSRLIHAKVFITHLLLIHLISNISTPHQTNKYFNFFNSYVVGYFLMTRYNNVNPVFLPLISSPSSVSLLSISSSAPLTSPPLPLFIRPFISSTFTAPDGSLCFLVEHHLGYM